MAFLRMLTSRTAYLVPTIIRRRLTPSQVKTALPQISSRQISYTSPCRDSALGDPSRPSVITKILSIITVTLFCTTTGFVIGAIPAFQAANDILHPPTDEETLKTYIPEDNFSREVEEYINSHPLAKKLRSLTEFSESRPHLKVPQSQRGHNLTGGTLLGPGRVAVPPFVWTDRRGGFLVAISYLGSDLCGHPGIVHGGFLATMLDEGMGKCCFSSLPNKIGMTANLNINYRAPAPACAFVVLRIQTTKVEGRKAWVEAQIETLVDEGEKPTVLVEASSLFIEPRRAATMARIYPTL